MRKLNASHSPRHFAALPLRRSATPRARSAFTLVEIIVVIIIIGILAAVIAPRLLSRVGQAKTATAESNAAALASAMRTFILDCGLPPPGSNITVLWECPSGVDPEAWKKGGPYVENPGQLNDPWGRQYLLIVPGKKNVDFDIVSYGADGEPGGEGEAADVVNGR